MRSTPRVHASTTTRNWPGRSKCGVSPATTDSGNIRRRPPALSYRKDRRVSAGPYDVLGPTVIAGLGWSLTTRSAFSVSSFLKYCQRAARSPPNSTSSSRRAARVSSTIGSLRTGSILHELLGSVDEWWLKAVASNDRVDSRNDERVCDVFAVPRQQVFESARRSDGDVKRIFIRVVPKASVLQECAREIHCRVSDFDESELASNCHSCCGHGLVATRCLRENNDGRIQSELLSP